jgi:hypothetical protein
VTIMGPVHPGHEGIDDPEALEGQAGVSRIPPSRRHGVRSREGGPGSDIPFSLLWDADRRHGRPWGPRARRRSFLTTAQDTSVLVRNLIGRPPLTRDGGHELSVSGATAIKRLARPTFLEVKTDQPRASGGARRRAGSPQYARGSAVGWRGDVGRSGRVLDAGARCCSSCRHARGGAAAVHRGRPCGRGIRRMEPMSRSTKGF